MAPFISMKRAWGGYELRPHKERNQTFEMPRDWLENWLSAADRKVNKRNTYMSLK